jgi:hypothetical protein
MLMCIESEIIDGEKTKIGLIKASKKVIKSLEIEFKKKIS